MRTPTLTSRRKTTQGTQLSAGALSALLTIVTTRGIEARARGTCLGDGIAARITIHSGGRVEIAAPANSHERSTALYRARTHARAHHDLGCSALGISLQALTHVAQRFDGQAAADYLCDALIRAAHDVEEHTRAGQRWSAEYARETVALELARRISPRELEALPQRDTTGSEARILRFGTRRERRAA